MIPFRRPFLDYILSSLADAGCLDVCLVIGPEHDAVRDYYERTSPPERVRVSFAVQQQARGTADAVLAAESFAARGPFLVLNADNYYPVDVLRALVALDGPGLPAFRRSTLIEQSNIDAERIRSYRVADHRRRPAHWWTSSRSPIQHTFARYFGDDVRVSMNCWRFGPSIFTACRSIDSRRAASSSCPMPSLCGARHGRSLPRHSGRRRRARPLAARRHRRGRAAAVGLRAASLTAVRNTDRDCEIAT